MRVTQAVTLLFTLVALAVAGDMALAEDGDTSPFMTIRGKTAQPIGHYNLCARDKSECAVRSRGQQRVQLTEERWNTLVDVNRAVNAAVRPVTDQDLFGEPEVWVYPTDRGDCEDFVLLKRRLLAERGWPLGGLLITVVHQQNGDGHAVLTVLTDHGDLVLDNLKPHISTWNDTPYRFLKRQSTYDSGQWVAVEDGRAAMVGSLSD
ncbi:transglutaminase-like cysteine peptidase [Bauldia sp.]|uniref:transglutaminase-like cysteine peptidase n=1 Tax=Bauldia sp. TaxID=2575872 RepID=UPI003BAA9097